MKKSSNVSLVILGITTTGRGCLLHCCFIRVLSFVQSFVPDKGASFSIGVTQSISSNTNRIYDSDDDKWVENKSKILYDPLAMKKNQSISKSNKEASSSSKSNIVKKKKNLKKEGKQHCQSPGLHCPKNIGLYVATFAEFLSDQINMPQDGFLLEYLCNRYATLLWKYGID
ncbi:hypothetical protein H5410_040443 [Solanum commersonii]|uniref:Ulp1 protease family, C-terminal catalytic domain containing protein n=1 Tax=Solanum commersonii TaxID=4109 RepID=A0A9J5XNX4_SOLCO|nr:hypothetical protein H5410_040443 [Solanum commersonii]